MARLAERVWYNAMLTLNTKMKVYQACVLSTLLYGSEAWTLYSRQEQRLIAFHMHCLRRLLGITWQNCITNADVLAQAGIPSMFAILSQGRLHWLGEVCRMDNGRIRKTSCTVSLLQECDQLDSLPYASRTPASATWRLVRSIQQTRSRRPAAAHTGELLSRPAYSKLKREGKPSGRRRGPAGDRDSNQLPLPPPITTPTASTSGDTDPTLGCTATAGPATPPWTNQAQTPLSPKTDGCQQLGS